MKKLRGVKAVIYICLPAGLVILLNLAGLRYNYSQSVSGKLWYEKRVNEYRKGDYVFLCIQDETILAQIKPYLIGGDCGGSVGMLKKVVGVNGDVATFSKNGIFINGRKVKNTEPIDNKHLLYKLNAYESTIILSRKHVVLVGETHDSLDSRYYGPIDTKWITGKATKLL